MPHQPNRLINEKSPYLLQHAHNPVDWYSWSEAAFKKARQESKPIFLSVGYSTCHWCHVMEKESFESEEVARVMNEGFVNVKVDREERPNVDRVYMTFVQATTGHGGWPMSVFLTPDLKPIFGGTYFPPSGFVKILEQISNMWKSNKQEVIRSGDRIIEVLRDALESKGASSKRIDSLTWNVLEKNFKYYQRTFDETYGGFGDSPKFPTPVTFTFLLRYASYAHVPSPLLSSLSSKSVGELRVLNEMYGLGLKIGSGGLVEKGEVVEGVRKGLERREGESEKAREMVRFTLMQIARGGIHDHVGLGFHRYSVDKYWHVPHFEKMLYDQAQLLTAYCEMYAITKDDFFAQIAADIIRYVERDLTSPEGGFYCAEDADSFPFEGATEKKEGAFAVWEHDEIVQILGADKAESVNYHFGVNKNGNVDPRQDPHHELTMKNVLMERHTIEETAQHFNLPVSKTREILQECKKTLWEARQKRPKPHLDDKVITSWNGLMISALAKAHQILVIGTNGKARGGIDIGSSRTRLLDLAQRAAGFFRDRMYDKDRKVVLRSFRGEPGDVEGFADDYAFLIQGLLDLYEASFDEKWVEWAVELQETQDKLFWDEVGGGYFSGKAGDKDILLRLKEDHDGAEPAASSVAAWNLLRLDALVPSAGDYKTKAIKTMEAFADQLVQHPQSMSFMASVVGTYQRGLKEIIIHAPATTSFLPLVQSNFLPNRTLALADLSASSDQSLIAMHNEAYKAILERGCGHGEVFVCKGTECGLPVGKEEEVRRVLEEV